MPFKKAIFKQMQLIKITTGVYVVYVPAQYMHQENSLSGTRKTFAIRNMNPEIES